MSIQAQAADGTLHEFPDNTDPAIIDKVMKDYATSNATGATTKADGASRDTFWDANKPDFEDQALRSLTFGLGDKVVSGIEAGRRAVFEGKKFGPEFEKLTAERDKQFEDYRAEHPVAGKVAQTVGVLGSMAAIGPAEGAQAAATMGGRALQGAGAGAAGGGLAAAGSSRGSLKDQLISTAVGTLAGGAIGYVTTPLFELASNAVRGTINRVRGWASSPEDQAAMTLTRAMARDNETPATIAARVNNANNQGVPLAPIDTGENMRGLGRALETRPGAARTTIVESLSRRAEGQADRVSDRVRDLFGGDATDLNDAARAIIARRAANAEADYAAAHADTIPVTNTMARLFNRPSIRTAIQNALRIAGEEGDDEAVATLTGLSQGGIPRNLNIKIGDYIKRGLDDVIEGSRDPVTRRLILDTAGRAAEGTRTAWRNALMDETTGSAAYRQALENWGDDSSLLDAARLGQRVFDRKIETRAFIDQFSRRTDAEREMARLGAAKELTDTIREASDNQNVIAKIFGSEDKRMRLRALFNNSDDFQRFEGAMRLEASLSRPYRGSQTTPLLSEQADMTEGLVTDMVRAAARRDPLAMARAVSDHFRRFGLDERATQLIADYLTGRATGDVIGALAMTRLANLAEGNLRVRLAIQAGDRALGEAAGQITALATQ